MNKEQSNVIPKLNKDVCSIAKKGKVLSKINKTGAVYRIICKQTVCDKVYVRESKRALYFYLIFALVRMKVT